MLRKKPMVRTEFQYQVAMFAMAAFDYFCACAFLYGCYQLWKFLPR